MHKRFVDWSSIQCIVFFRILTYVWLRLLLWQDTKEIPEEAIYMHAEILMKSPVSIIFSDIHGVAEVLA